MSKATDFRYNTGNTRVPWAAVGENYNVNDLMEVIKFLMQGEGPEYDVAVSAVKEQIEKLDAVSVPPGCRRVPNPFPPPGNFPVPPRTGRCRPGGAADSQWQDSGQWYTAMF